MTLNNSNVDLVHDNVSSNLVKFCPFSLKILRKKQFLTSIKGRNYVANLRRIMHYKFNVDLVKDELHKKIG